MLHGICCCCWWWWRRLVLFARLCSLCSCVCACVCVASFSPSCGLNVAVCVRACVCVLPPHLFWTPFPTPLGYSRVRAPRQPGSYGVWFIQTGRKGHRRSIILICCGGRGTFHRCLPTRVSLFPSYFEVSLVLHQYIGALVRACRFFVWCFSELCAASLVWTFRAPRLFVSFFSSLLFA